MFPMILRLFAIDSFGDFSTFQLSADPTNNPPLVKIGTGDTTNFYGKQMIVTGTVAQVSIRPNIVFVNLDKPYPNSPFALVIFPAATNQFGDLKALKGAAIEASGKITKFHDRPEMVLEKSNQLKVTTAQRRCLLIERAGFTS